MFTISENFPSISAAKHQKWMINFLDLDADPAILNISRRFQTPRRSMTKREMHFTKTTNLRLKTVSKARENVNCVKGGGLDARSIGTCFLRLVIWRAALIRRYYQETRLHVRDISATISIYHNIGGIDNARVQSIAMNCRKPVLKRGSWNWKIRMTRVGFPCFEKLKIAPARPNGILVNALLSTTLKVAPSACGWQSRKCEFIDEIFGHKVFQNTRGRITDNAFNYTLGRIDFMLISIHRVDSPASF